ncbi:MAG: hypothetical protein M3S32_01830 [Acidobacteriota bacterium]|nr:hypothetical protein [Acidobacteriota bacterium]
MTLKTIGPIAILALAGVAFVASPADAAPRNRRRAENQQDRIAQGVGSGQLTARETARLETREARLNGRVRDMRQDNGGSLTPRERARVNRQQNRISRDIYRQKHDAQTAAR